MFGGCDDDFGLGDIECITTSDGDHSGVLCLPDPVRAPFANDSPKDGAKYQLTLRVDDATSRYLNALAHKAEAETVSELVRMSLRALEVALKRYDHGTRLTAK